MIYLFPLNIVLFPGSQVRLHIFEPRYKLMIGRCTTTRKEFGINFVDENILKPIGCTAQVIEVTKRYSDGTFDIIVEGVERFRIIDSDHTDEDLLLAEIEVIPDSTEMPGRVEIDEAIDLYNKLVAAAYKGKIDTIERWDDLPLPRSISYRLAEKSGLSLERRQELLEILSETERLRIVSAHIKQTLPVIQDQDRLRELIMNDGYLPRLRG